MFASRIPQSRIPQGRIPQLALAADVTAVVVFAAVGRVSHGEADDLFGLLATAAPFLVALGASWTIPAVRVNPSGLRAGMIVVAGTALLGLLLRAGFTGRLPLTFALITFVSLLVLLLGWRLLSQLVASRAVQHVP